MTPPLLLALAAPAFAVCDDPLFSLIPAPPPTDDKHGVATATSTFEGKSMVGGRFSIDSAYTPDVWRKVLLAAENQDEWVPKRFGYEVAEWIDAEFMYLRFDIGFLLNSVHVQRQLVVRVTSGQVGDNFRTCWRMIDPAPHLSKITHLTVEKVDWEKTSMGWWEVTPEADGTAIVNYQWWAEKSAVPTAIQRWGMSNTLPDLLDAFEVRVGELGGR